VEGVQAAECDAVVHAACITPGDGVVVDEIWFFPPPKVSIVFRLCNTFCGWQLSKKPVLM
jgi:hypothetical protein